MYLLVAEYFLLLIEFISRVSYDVYSDNTGSYHTKEAFSGLAYAAFSFSFSCRISCLSFIACFASAMYFSHAFAIFSF